MKLLTIENRVAKVRLNDAVTPWSADDLIADIERSYGQKAVAENMTVGTLQCSADEALETLEIEINSPGGSVLDGVKIFNQIVAVPIAIQLYKAEGIAIPTGNIEIKNCDVRGNFSTAAVSDGGSTPLLLNIHDNVFKNVTAATAVISFSGNSTGTMKDNFISGRHTTQASNVVTGTGMDWSNNDLVEEASVDGSTYPIQDTD